MGGFGYFFEKSIVVVIVRAMRQEVVSFTVHTAYSILPKLLLRITIIL